MSAIVPQAALAGMPRPYRLDTLICGLGTLLTVTMLAARWREYSSWWNHSGSPGRGPIMLGGLAYLLMALLSRLTPRFYGRHRSAIIVFSKMLVLAVAAKKQVRLNKPPTGRLAADVFSALFGEAGRGGGAAKRTNQARCLHCIGVCSTRTPARLLFAGPRAPNCPGT